MVLPGEPAKDKLKHFHSVEIIQRQRADGQRVLRCMADDDVHVPRLSWLNF